MGVYRDLVRVPGVLNVTASQLFARLPMGMLNLAILLHVHSTSGSYAVAGLVVASLSLGEAVAMPVTARLAGRFGRVPTLLVTAVVNGAGMLGLALSRGPTAVLMVLGVLIGASVPPLLPVVRALYPQMVPRSVVRALFALDTTAQELIWVVGPLAATFLAAAISTATPLVLSAGVTIVGTCWFLLGAKRFPSIMDHTTSSFGTVLRSRAVLLAVVASAALVASFMALEVGIVADLGGGLAAGAAIAVGSAGSLVGGLVFGHRRLGITGLVGALSVVALGTALFGAADSLALQFTALFFSGLGFAPALSVLYIMVSQETAEHAASEAFGWLTSAALVGGALGTAAAGPATDAYGSTGAIVVSVTLGVIAALSPLVARATGPLPGLTQDPIAEEPTSEPCH
ncbi:MFS transporter [soil metagenome]